MYEDYYGHDPVMVTQMPTLCEVAYNKTDWPPEPTWSDTVPAIPYRHSFTKKQDQRSPTQSQHHQDYKSACGVDSLHGMNMAEVAMASPSLYRHSMYSPTAVAGRTMCDRVTTVGYRTPMSYASQYRSGTLLSMYDMDDSVSSNQVINIPAYNYQSDPNFYQDKRGRHPGQKSSRVMTAPCATSLPQLPGHRSHSHATTMLACHDGDAAYRKWWQEEGGFGEEKLVWVPALNAWVSDKDHSPGSYLSFVNSMNLINKGLRQDRHHPEDDLPILPCGRYLAHMHTHEATLSSLSLQKEARLNQLKARRDKYDSQQLKPHKQHTKSSSSSHIRNQLNADRHTSRVSFDERTKSPSHSEPSAPSLAADVGSDPGSEGRLGSSEGVVDADSAGGSIDRQSEDYDMNNGEEEGKDSQDASRISAIDTSLADRGWSAGDCDSDLHDVMAQSMTSLLPLHDKETQQVVIPSSQDVTYNGESWKQLSNNNSNNYPQRGTRSKRETNRVKKTPRPEKSPSKSKVKSVVTKRPPKPDGKKKAGSKTGGKTAGYSVEREDTAALEMNVKSETEVNVALPEPPRTQVEKRVRWRAQPKPKGPPQEDGDSNAMTGKKKRGGDWIFDGEDFSTEIEKHEPSPTHSPTSLSPPPLVTPPPEEDASSRNRGDRRSSKVLPDWAKQRWGRKKFDKSLEDERRRLQLAEERRKKAQLMFDKLKNRRHGDGEDGVDANGPRYEDYGWLAKYCIFNKESLTMYQRTFEAVDSEGHGWLSPVDTMVGLRASNRALTDTQEYYLYRVLEMTGYSVTKGADFKLFAVMAALSQRIASLDDWMKNLIGRMDMQMLDHKAFMCKTLWEVNVDAESQKIPIHQLCVELKAGGVSLEHEREVREKLGPLRALDLLDFLTYIPLFLMIHTSVVGNPLDDSRQK